MLEVFRSSAGEGRVKVQAVILDVEASTLIWVLGGDKPHIGAVAVAQARPSLTGKGISCNISLISLLGHKEEELAVELAKIAFSKLKKDLAVAVGLHVDNATKEDIEALKLNSKKALESGLYELVERLSGGKRPT